MEWSDLAKIAAGAVSGAGVGAFLDFYIGDRGQARLRAWLENWWLRFNYVKLTNFGREEAIYAISVMDRFFGEKFFSLKRIVWALAILALGSIPAYLHRSKGQFILFGFPNNQLIFASIQFILLFLFSMKITCLLLNWSSQILGVSALYNMLIFLCAFVLQVCIVMYFGDAVTSLILFVTGSAYRPTPGSVSHGLDFLDDPSFWFPVVLKQIQLSSISRFEENIDVYGGYYILQGASGVIRMLLFVVFLLSVLLCPLHSFILTIWLRVTESKKPICTLVLGSIGSLVQISLTFLGQK